MKIIYSWILPIKNEEQVLPKLIKDLKRAMRGRSYEIIAVDDASDDNSYESLLSAEVGHDFFPHLPNSLHSSAIRRTRGAQGGGRAQKVWPSRRLLVIRLSSPQGKWAALREGIKVAKGEIIITSDSDWQDDPKEVKELLAKLKSHDLVSGWRKVRHDPFLKILISRGGNYLVSILYKKDFKDLNSPFKVYRRNVVESIPKDGSLLRYSMLFAHKMGYKTIEVPVTHRPRIYGKSKFGVIKYLRIIYDILLIFLLFSGSGRLTRGK
ncbi:glycosyltransferase family 2 protein [Candidatus Gottesmanbacteria bacterium]|nr:glycosyltransferase family 2 protein [Candidatus Gottesmanbacteria bacterium]